MLDSGSIMRLYTIGGQYAELNGSVWNAASIPALPISKVTGLHDALEGRVKNASGVTHLRQMTQAAYNALNPKDPNTVYIII